MRGLCLLPELLALMRDGLCCRSCLLLNPLSLSCKLFCILLGRGECFVRSQGRLLDICRSCLGLLKFHPRLRHDSVAGRHAFLGCG